MVDEHAPTKGERREAQRRKLRKKMALRHGKRLTDHHLKNRCKKGNENDCNIVLLEEERHRAWHLLFGNADPYQAIQIIERMIRMRGYEDEACTRC